MFRHAVMQYWVHEYIMDIYVCEKCKFTLFIESPSYFFNICMSEWQYIVHNYMNTLFCVLKGNICHTQTHSLYKFTSSNNCLSRWSWASNWRLWSSSICIRASNRPLCWRNSFASASKSHSGGLGPPGRCADSSGVEPGVCLDRKRSYSAWRDAFSSSSSL
jgi:hypothetical protein